MKSSSLHKAKIWYKVELYKIEWDKLVGTLINLEQLFFTKMEKVILDSNSVYTLKVR